MRKALSVLTSLLVGLAAAHTGRADNTWELSVQVSAEVQTSPARVTLTWPQDTYASPTSYTIFRKAPGATSWGPGTTLPGTSVSFVDQEVAAGNAYEYQIIKNGAGYTGYGYIVAGLNLPLIDHRGRLLLVVDNTHATQLRTELARLQHDLVGDGWTVTRIDVNRDETPAKVKDLIRGQYNADPANTKAVFLFGHVPVPYSGNIVPDGHGPEHQGAWPADGYYGDMTGLWTDQTVNVTGASDARTRNVPGDGKFDQSAFPAPVTLMVGRVDLANMPGRLSWGGEPTFPSELELLRNYLNKSHRFRQKQIDLPRRAVVGDYFGYRDGEAFAASGWRNFSTFVGADNVLNLPDKGTWIPHLKNNEYLWAYGCGAGSFTSIGGLGNTGRYRDGVTPEMYQNDVKAAFTLLFGSWLGDWDSEDNLMRSVLALPSHGLTCGWSGRPHWFLHHMALGEPIGHGARLTQNNIAGLYRNQQNNCAGQIHIALMGDPTLRMHMVAPVTNLRSQNGGSSLSWTASADTVTGYHVYRAADVAGPYSRLTSTPIAATTYTDATAAPGQSYMVRAIKLETSASGSYENASQGAFLTPSDTEFGSGPAGNGASDGSNNQALEPTGDPGTTTADAGGSEIWMDDALPAGAQPGADGGDSWTWVNSNPAPVSGIAAHQSSLATGLHQHYFSSATSTLAINAGDVLFAYVFLDPANPPSEVMLQWNDGSWEHRAYWGADRITYGTAGTAGRRYMGPLPAAGQWVLLQVPASQVALEGRTLSGMAFSLFDGRASWDLAGKSSSLLTEPGPSTNLPPTNTNVVTNPGGGASTNIPSQPAIGPTNTLPGTTLADYVNLEAPTVGANSLHVLTPSLLELKLINSKPSATAPVSQWDVVDGNSQFRPPPPSAFTVLVNNQPVGVNAIGFKRRPIWAPIATYDLRLENALYLQLATSVAEGQTVEVRNPDGTLWGAGTKFVTTTDPLRFNPGIHVNQEGYMPSYPKKAMVGYYAGSMGEVTLPTSGGFKLVNATTGATVFQGTLTARPDVGYTYGPTPYQKVYEADFTGFNTPGEYRLVVPGMGGSLPFLIDSGIAMGFARTYALGLYHQRCGTSTDRPWTSHTHAKCHAVAAEVPASSATHPFAWTTIANYANTINQNNPPQIAPALTSPGAQLFPFVRQGTLDVSGGHHDAGDYSKYTINSASLVHYLMFSADGLAGVSGLDNLGIPESGDGIGDVLQEAKWEADFLAKMQDSDGGFYFLVYPKNREYEGDVTPDRGDPQIVYPKTLSVTAASVAALAQCASSPQFKQAYPQAAAMYLEKARLGWQFLQTALGRYGKNGAYQKITHYGDDFADNDELAWAAAEMFIATGDANIHQQLKSWFDPANPATWRWGWWHMSQAYGHAIRSYAFAARTGRLAAGQLDAAYLAKCEAEIVKAGDDCHRFSLQNAYGSSFPENTKQVKAAGWYFSTDQAFDLAVAHQVSAKSQYIDSIVANMNFEGGCNPVNVSYVTGLGWKRQRDVVNQWAVNDSRILPPPGQPVGNITANYGYLWNYGSLLNTLSFPADGAATAPYPFYDRWTDGWNVNAEFVVLNSARSLGALSYLASLTPLRSQSWKGASGGRVIVPAAVVPVGQPVTLAMDIPGMDLAGARIVWEARDQEPAFGATYTISPKNNGTQWVEAEAQWPDGRRVFASGSFTANSPNITWIDDALPAGATAGADGGDSWEWVTTPAPQSGTKAHRSTARPGIHQHYFDFATATLTVGTGDILYAWVYLDPASPPMEVMLQWNDGSWEHRAYWGANQINYGVDGTASRRYMGPLPATGQWVQLKVPASQVGLEGRVVKGMAFSLYNGGATWDAAGSLSPVSTPTTGLRIESLTYSTQGATITWNSEPNGDYQVQYKNNLTDPTWTPAAQVRATANTTSWLDTTARQVSKRFYRVANAGQ